jgi:NADPH:quinone reductase-like Zn-dependent oxidoreductase
MKAIQLEKFGIENLRLVDIPKPEPGEHEILVKINATAIQYLDGALVEGKLAPNLAFPYIPGCEAAGVVAAVGKHVTRWKTGDRVLVPFVERWEAGKTTTYHNAVRTGVNLPGTLSEYRVAPENTVVRSPRNLTDQEAATLPVIGLTAWASLVNQAKIRPGQTILVQGSGGISLFALQIAKAFGLTIIATSGDDGKAARLKELGASAVVNYKKNKNWSEQVKAANGGQGVDVTLDVAGTETIEQSILSCKENGYVGLIGFMTGSKLSIDAHQLIMNYIRLQGYSVGNSEELGELVTAIETTAIRPVIDRVFSFEQVQDAFNHLIGGQAFGRIVILQ